jgi:hypothetical protein
VVSALRTVGPSIRTPLAHVLDTGLRSWTVTTTELTKRRSVDFGRTTSSLCRMP